MKHHLKSVEKHVAGLVILECRVSPNSWQESLLCILMKVTTSGCFTKQQDTFLVNLVNLKSILLYPFEYIALVPELFKIKRKGEIVGDV